MAGLIAKAVFGSVKVATKYVVVPILYTALLGYLMQEASRRLRVDPDEEEADDAMIKPAR